MEKDRDIFLISIFTFLTISLWIFFELVKTTKTTTVPATVEKIVTPLNPTLDTGVLSALELRKSY